jgi:NAD(P)-dependent dehydrogenase (short-subunit alcohol dehydrogenase family)
MENESKKLLGKVAIVTGASRGIGRAIAIALGRAGAKVVIAARDAEALEDVAAQIRNQGGEAIFCVFDLRNPDKPSELVTRTIEKFGVIDIVVNNAGATKRGEFLELTEEDWTDGFALKFFGYVRLLRAAWPHLKNRHGSVINIAGVGGRSPGAEFTIGGSVNAALLSLTKALVEKGIVDDVQINAINPGPVRTDRLRVRLEQVAKSRGITIEEAEDEFIRIAEVSRIGEPEDIANLVVFAVSPGARFLQGALIDMDGGQTKTI